MGLDCAARAPAGNPQDRRPSVVGVRGWWFRSTLRPAPSCAQAPVCSRVSCSSEPQALTMATSASGPVETRVLAHANLAPVPTPG